MSADFQTGFFVREPAWHNLGNLLDHYPGSWDEAAILAGLDWDPEERPIYDVVELYPDGRAKIEAIPDFKQIVRSDNDVRLAIANETYTLTLNSVMGEIIEGLLEAGESVEYEAAGALGKGERTWALLRLGKEHKLSGDPSGIQHYLALLNSHDGSSALRAILTSVRIVCANTWHAAEMQAARTGACYSFRHTKNWRDRVTEAKRALSKAGEHRDKIIERAEELLAVQVDKAMRDHYVKQFAIKRVIHNTVTKLPVTKRNMPLEDRLAQPHIQSLVAQTIRDLDAILNGPTCQGIAGTAYGLMQAAGELTDHYRTRTNEETYFTRTMMDTQPLKSAAYKLATELVPA